MTVGASVRVHCHGCIFGIDWYDDFDVGLELDDLSAGIAIDLDSSDPAAPKVTRIYPPTVSFGLQVTSTNDVVQFLGWIGSDLVTGVGRAVANAALVYLVQKINVAQVSPQVIGGSSTLAPVAPADLEGAAVKLENDMVANKMPYGDCVEGWFDRDYAGTWEQSLNDPTFTPGNLDLVQVSDAGDSACNSGWYLAGLAFRHATTHAPEALSRAKQMIATYHTLLNMRGTPGDLNRSVTPYSPAIWATFNPADGNWVGTYNGQSYVMSGYISRDAYTGCFFGLSAAHDLIDDPQVKADAAANLESALDYLLAKHWTHRKPDGSYDERWQGCIEQQYAWVNAAYACDPVKYGPVLDQYKGYADLIWASVWTGVIDPYYQYFKFGLCSASLHTALRTETDPVRWQRTYQGLAILRHYIGHHQNAQLNDVYLAADPSSVARLGAENQNLLTRWLRQPRRYMIDDLRNDPTIEKTTYSLPIDPNSIVPNSGQTQTVVVAKYPIPVERRVSASIRWDRSPYSLHEDYLWGPQPRHEGESIDYQMPYWMARYYRAIPGPRRHPSVGAASASATATATSIR
jgi:hypothetical protein